MLHRDLYKFYESIPKDKSIMCIDMGEKQVGVAFSDKTQLIATSHSIYFRRNTNKDLGYFNRILKENEAGSLVIGLPLEMNEQENEWCNKVTQFASKIANRYKINVYLQDEVLSTFIATHILKITGISIAKSKQINDKISACIILQRALNKINSMCIRKQRL